MFIFEILIYVFFAWVMSTLAKESRRYHPYSELWDKYIKWYMAFFTFVTAFRYGVGADYFSYEKILETGMITEQRADQEIIWNQIVSFNSHMRLNAAFGFGLCAFLQIYFLVKACGEKNKFILVALPIVMFGSRYYLDITGFIRQITAACMFVWFSKYILERKPLRYFTWIIIASLFHHSALMLSVFYFLPVNFSFARKRNLMLIIFTPCFLIGMTPQFSSFIEQIQTITLLTGYEQYTTTVTDYISGKRDEALSFGPIMISFLLIALYLIWYGPKLRERYGDKIPMFNVWYNLSFIFACLYFLVANTGHLFIRPVQYLEFFQMIMAAILLYDLWEHRNSSLKNKHTAVAFVIIIWTSTLWGIIKDIDLPSSIVIYKSIFFH